MRDHTGWKTDAQHTFSSISSLGSASSSVAAMRTLLAGCDSRPLPNVTLRPAATGARCDGTVAEARDAVHRVCAARCGRVVCTSTLGRTRTGLNIVFSSLKGKKVPNPIRTTAFVTWPSDRGRSAARWH
eukprot:9492138-Pyramimonas_sp.AAC.1